jgi:hypothetical protein
MNVHIENKEIFNDYWNSTIFSMKMGSVLYGLNDKFSDTDFISIRAPSRNQIYSFTKSIHQVQYKDLEYKVDYVFTDVFSFFWYMLNGDYTINFEIMHSDDFKKSYFGSFFNFLTKDLKTYNIILAYLGFANRDIKYFFKKETDRDKIKKLLHIERSLYFAKKIFYDYENFNLIVPELIDKKNELLSMKKEDLNNDFFVSKLSLLTMEISNFRKDILNVSLEKKEIFRFLSLESQKKLDEALFNLSKDAIFVKKQQEFIDNKDFYFVNENGLKY